MNIELNALKIIKRSGINTMDIVVRRVLPYEYPKYRTHLKSLDSESRTLRFGFPVKDETIDALCNGIEKNTSDHILFCIENSKLEFVGMGHIALNPEMELAFSVLSDYRHRGYGNALMDRAVQYCRTHNLLKGHMVCLSSNTAIKKMCIKHGIRMQNDHGETTGSIVLDTPDIKTFIDESLALNAGAADYIFKRAFIPWKIYPN